MMCCAAQEEPGVEDYSDEKLAGIMENLFNSPEYTLPMLFPMWVISAKDLVELKPPLKAHAEMKAMGLLKEYDPSSNRKAVVISHQWLSREHPDPNFHQISVLQSVLKALAAGTLKCSKDLASEAVGADIPMLTKEEEASALDWDVWFDYFGCPQIKDRGDDEQTKDLVSAVNSIPAYVDMASFVIVLAPSAKHADTGHTCNLASWSSRGWCIMEKLATILSQKRKPFLVLTKSGGLTSTAGSDLCSQFPVDGNFTVESDRNICVNLTKQLLARKCAGFLREGNLGYFRMFNALKMSATRSHETGACKMASTMEEFLEEYQFRRVNDKFAMGLTPLMCAALSGNVAIVRELVAAKANLEDRLKQDFADLSLFAGHTAFSVAGAFSTKEVMTTLLELKADTTACDNTLGNQALGMAAWFGNLKVLDLLVANKMDPNYINKFGCTPAQISSLNNNMPVARRIMELKGDPNHGDFIGSSGANSCITYGTDPEFISIITEFGFDPNLAQHPKGLLFKMLNWHWRSKVRKGTANGAEENFAMNPTTPIFQAILSDAPEHMVKLLQAKADPEQTFEHAVHGKVDAFAFAKKQESHACLALLNSTTEAGYNPKKLSISKVLAHTNTPSDVLPTGLVGL